MSGQRRPDDGVSRVRLPRLLFVPSISGAYGGGYHSTMITKQLAKQPSTAPIAYGTNGSEAHPKQWIAILVQSNCEKRSALQLKKAGFESYIPVQQEVHQWSDRRKTIQRLVIPMIVFVHCTPQEQYRLRELACVHKLLALPGSLEAKQHLATAIPDAQIDALRFLLQNANSSVSLASDLNAGDFVQVTSGPLRGMKGIVAEVEGKSMIAIKLELFGYVCVKIDRKDVLKENINTL